MACWIKSVSLVTTELNPRRLDPQYLLIFSHSHGDRYVSDSRGKSVDVVEALDLTDSKSEVEKKKKGQKKKNR